MAAQMTPRFRDLPDVDWASFADGEVATYDSGTDTLTGEAAAGGGGGDVTQQDLQDHADDGSFVHGIVNTGDLATDTELAAHIADTTAVHGVADTANIILSGDSRLTDQRTPTDGSVIATKVNTALKPSGAAVSTDESLRRLGTGATHAAAGDDARFPTAGEKNALAGTTGTPGVANRYVTETDPGLGGGVDEDDVVVLAPTSTADNMLQPLSNAAVGLTISGHATQESNLQEWRDPDGDMFVAVGSGDDAVGGQFISAQTGSTAATFLWSGGGISNWMPDADPTRGALTVGLMSDAADRLQVLANGKVQLGNGTDVLDTELSRVAVNVLAVPFLEFSEGSAPPTPAANKVRQFVRDNAGTTQVCHLYPSGNIVVVSEDF